MLLGTFSALWIADNIITAMEIRKLPKKLRALQAIEDSLTAISDEIGEEIYIRASDAKDRGMEVYTGMKEKSTELAQKRAEASIERRSELLARRSELLQRREEILSHRNIVHERIAQAFPALRSGQTNGRAFTRVHEHAQRRKELTKAVKAKAKALKNKAKRPYLTIRQDTERRRTMNLYLIGHDYRYAAEQMLLTLFPDERPEYPDGRPTGDRAELRLMSGTKVTTVTCVLVYHGQTANGRTSVPNGELTDPAETDRRLQGAIKRAFYRAAMGIGLPHRPWGYAHGRAPRKAHDPAACAGAQRRAGRAPV